MAQFGLAGLRSLHGLLESRFREVPARALLAGIAAHAMLPLDLLGTASFGLVLGTSAHAVGWPIPIGGSQTIADAMVAHYLGLGGELLLQKPVTRLSELPSARAYLLDVTPRQLMHMELEALPSHYRKRLSRFRYGPGVYKMDWALRGPVPWKDAACARAITVHLSGTYEDVARAEACVHQGKLADEPFVLFTQPSLFDASRAPPGNHVGWAYCHVPHGSMVDASEAMEAHIERHAPGFRELILARSVKSAVQMEHYNANYVGGDINGGLADLTQLFFRPVLRADPYATPAPHIFLCSSSTPPGGGVHGMCGYHAARSVLRRVFAMEVEEEELPEPLALHPPVPRT
jgi:phytoene dehydrogenase-like protein